MKYIWVMRGGFKAKMLKAIKNHKERESIKEEREIGRAAEARSQETIKVIKDERGSKEEAGKKEETEKLTDIETVEETDEMKEVEKQLSLENKEKWENIEGLENQEETESKEEVIRVMEQILFSQSPGNLGNLGHPGLQGLMDPSTSLVQHRALGLDGRRKTQPDL